MLVVIAKMFLQICVHKLGSGDNARSLSHFVLGSVTEWLEVEMSL